MGFKILVVEDQMTISDIVSKYLEKEGYDYDVVDNGLEALKLFSLNHYHLIILDVMLPGIDGYQVLQQIKQVSDVPVIMLTARKDETDRLRGFNEGADDYVVKPFSVKELMSRIHVILKRVYKSDEVIRCHPFVLNLKSYKLIKGDLEILLSSAEFKLMKLLMQNEHHVLSRNQIISEIYGYDYEGVDRNIDSQIKRLRQKIEDDVKHPIYLKTKYGAGYIFGGSNDD